jgi:sugar phosphate isomerase/epimerase
VDLYHTWWDPQFQQQIERAGVERLLAFHICDWLVPTTDMLLDRGMMGTELSTSVAIARLSRRWATPVCTKWRSSPVTTGGSGTG